MNNKKEILIEVPKGQMVDCPECGKVYTVKEYNKLKSVGNVKNLYDAKICSNCITIFSITEFVITEKGNIRISMNLDLY